MKIKWNLKKKCKNEAREGSEEQDMDVVHILDLKLEPRADEFTCSRTTVHPTAPTPTPNF